jgi:hypothetical protein
MIVPRAALQAGLKALLELGEGAAQASRDSGGDPAWLADLEERAAAIDRLEEADEAEQRARAAVKRRLLLAELDTLHADLDEAAYPLLAAYRRAAKARRRYARRKERARTVPGSEAGADPAVSLDWFRLRAKAPRGWTADEWLAHAEAALLAADVPPEQAEGELFVRDGSGWTSIAWRREDGSTPVVLRAAPA